MDSLTSAGKSQLMAGNSITSQTLLSPPTCAIRRPYSVESAYHRSLVAEPTVVPSPVSSQAHYSHKHDGCQWFECKTVGEMERCELARTCVLLLLQRSHGEHGVHLPWTTQMTRQRALPTREIHNENAEIKWALWGEAAACKTENNLHTRGDDASGILLS